MNKYNQLKKSMKSYIEDIVYVSKMTKVEKKKLRIFITVILSNLTAATDIGIILIFTSIISNSFKSENILSFLIDILKSQLKLLKKGLLISKNL